MTRFEIPEKLADQRTRIVEALQTVMDPELQVNVFDLGLIYLLRIDDLHIRVELTLSSKNCPMSESILSGVNHCIQRNFPAHEVQVILVWEPEWNYRMIPEAGIKKLRGL